MSMIDSDYKSSENYSTDTENQNNEEKYYQYKKKLYNNPSMETRLLCAYDKKKRYKFVFLNNEIISAISKALVRMKWVVKHPEGSHRITLFSVEMIFWFSIRPIFFFSSSAKGKPPIFISTAHDRENNIFRHNATFFNFTSIFFIISSLVLFRCQF